MDIRRFRAHLALWGLCCAPVWAAEAPYFVTYSHQLEEQGNLEIEVKTATGRSAGGNRFFASAVEFEYGVTGWWTTEFYLDGQVTAGESTLFTGDRWENRFRFTKEEHWINPVLYLEFENTTGADKTLLEVVGHDSKDDLLEPNAVARLEHQREIEGKLLLGSQWRGWDISENFIVEKNVVHEPWEFGYAAGISRPFALAARPERCKLCPENFIGGVEVYGGLGDTHDLTLAETAHYVAPTIQWTSPSGVALKVSPSFGLTASSVPVLWRFGVSYEVSQFGRRWHKQ